MTPSPYRLEVKVKNNRVWSALVAVCPHFTSISDAARQLGLSATNLGDALNMTDHFRATAARTLPCDQRPFGIRAQRIARALHSAPEYLFDADLYFPDTVTSQFVIEGPREILQLYGPQTSDPLELTEQHELSIHIDKALSPLTPREENMVRRRFGIGEDYE